MIITNLKDKPARRKRGDEPPKIGLACAGGGIEGAVYEIGALCALDEVLTGVDFRDLHVYVGVSAGALISACLANGLTPRQMSLAILSQQSEVHPIVPETFFTPAFGEYVSRVTGIPGLLWDAVTDYVKKPGDLTITASLFRMMQVLPVGVFDNDPLRAYLEKNFSEAGRTDSFYELKNKLRIVATDLDSSHSVVFGSDGFDSVPISKAVQASTALPVVYLPVEINGRNYIDGVAQRTVHASVALQEGADFVFCINPIVPYEAVNEIAADDPLKNLMVKKGLPAVLSQTFRTMIHSRMKVGIKQYQHLYPGKDLIIFEPDSHDYRMFFTNIFSFSSRYEICEHAYQTTRASLRKRMDEIAPAFERAGIGVRESVLNDTSRSLYSPMWKNGHDTGKLLSNTLQELDSLLAKIA